MRTESKLTRTNLNSKTRKENSNTTDSDSIPRHFLRKLSKYKRRQFLALFSVSSYRFGVVSVMLQRSDVLDSNTSNRQTDNETCKDDRYHEL